MTIDDASLLAYVDGELPPEDRARIETAIGTSQELASRVTLLRASQLPYGEAFAQQALPPVPESLARSVDELIRRHRAGMPLQAMPDEEESEAPDAQSDASLGDNVHRLRPRARRLLPAVSWPKLAVAFVAGAFCCGLALQFAPRLSGGGFLAASNDAGMTPWIKAAAGYQQLYSRDTIAALQPDMGATATTVADIHQVDDLALQIPDLRSQGLTFKRVQRLRFHDKPLVQIVYLPEKGKPVALCVLKEAKADAAPAGHRVDGMSVVAWRRGQLGYALIGAPGDIDLDALGKQLYNGQVPTTIGAADTTDPTGGHGRRA
ncbi:anti-sigma factor family protein [Burkholderia perseverans]|uniref:anti-sigma factor family protein n=1 Tax=Burkholderia perseverans TaxID=2615214 RepID=UPI001FEE912A|nr:anti-sigma factor [Burkholderia perseverans]